MMHSLRSLMIVVILAPSVLAGCGRRPTKFEQIRGGIENVDKHAKEIEKADEPIGTERAAP